MKKDNIYKTLVLTILVIILLILLHFLPPITLFGTQLRKIDILSDLAPKEKPAAKVIQSPSEPSVSQIVDSNGRTIEFKEEWPKGVEPIKDYAAGKPNGLDGFYEKLTLLANKQAVGRPVRIAYFGDSYIEGDILLADLREDLQQLYGGYGIGWLDAGNDINQYKHTVTNKFSGLVEHMVKKPTSYDVQKAGIAERYYTASGPVQISLAPFELHEYKHTDMWERTQLYLLTTGGTSVNFAIDGGKSQTITLAPSNSVQVAEVQGRTSNALIKLLAGNAILYGTAQESAEGVMVDNFSMRGSGGQTLAHLPEKMLKEFANIRPYDLIVFQFGVNAITPETTTEKLKKYIDEMKLVVEHFKKCFPETSILVMGCPDRGSKSSTDGTMKGVEELETLQAKLAKDCQVGFYSLFNAMGGAGSMIKMVDEQDMGTKDYTHINYKGGKYVSQRIFKSIVAGQKNYARKRRLIEGQ